MKRATTVVIETTLLQIEFHKELYVVNCRSMSAKPADR